MVGHAVFRLFRQCDVLVFFVLSIRGINQLLQSTLQTCGIGDLQNDFPCRSRHHGAVHGNNDLIAQFACEVCFEVDLKFRFGFGQIAGRFGIVAGCGALDFIKEERWALEHERARSACLGGDKVQATDRRRCGKPRSSALSRTAERKFRISREHSRTVLAVHGEEPQIVKAATLVESFLVFASMWPLLAQALQVDGKYYSGPALVNMRDPLSETAGREVPSATTVHWGIDALVNRKIGGGDHVIRPHEHQQWFGRARTRLLQQLLWRQQYDRRIALASVLRYELL